LSSCFAREGKLQALPAIMRYYCRAEESDAKQKIPELTPQPLGAFKNFED
jgi:hypothetical protein